MFQQDMIGVTSTRPPKRTAARIAERGIRDVIAFDKRCPEDFSVPELSPDCVKVSKNKMGSGTHANVFAGTFRRANVAVKILKHSSDEYKAEARILKHCKHENVLKVFGVFTARHGQLAIVTELCERCLLLEVFRTNDASVFQKHTTAFIKQIALALEHIHARNIIHRDVCRQHTICCRAL